jgi:iron complex outermembrane receptor protein
MIQTIERKNINTGKIKNIGIELETTYHISETWHLNANFSFLHMEYPVIAAPTYKGYVGANFNKGRWTASANMQFIGDLYTAIGKEEYLETFCLVDAYIGFKLSDNIVMWTRAENLLAQEYEINFGYPMPKTTAMIGLSINI